ncbi:MAG: hypothetical protein HFH86_02655 [Bacilli bacterium]|nr:hypothetical protein [Bacilli bacterium]
MPNKLLLIDGQSLIWQTDHKLPQKIEGKNGQNIEDIWGFTKILQKMIQEVNPTHVLLFFEEDWQDIERKEWFLAILQEWKISYIEVTKNNIPSAIQSYCDQFHKDAEITIGASSYDYFNLITSQIKLLSFKNCTCSWFTKEKIKNKWKIEPQFYADYKALVGDDKNSISGIPRIGPKLAASLINDYGHIEQILNHIEQIPKDNVRLTLDIFQKDLLTNIELLRFPIRKITPYPLENMKFDNQKNSVKELLKRVNLL